jgi:uncharacterized membrane-anchored protein
MTDQEFRYPFFLQKAFMLGVIITFADTFLDGLNILINNYEKTDSTTDKIFGWIKVIAALIIVLFLIIWRCIVTKSTGKLILRRV